LCVALREKHIFQALENEVIEKIFGPKGTN